MSVGLFLVRFNADFNTSIQSNTDRRHCFCPYTDLAYMQQLESESETNAVSQSERTFPAEAERRFQLLQHLVYVRMMNERSAQQHSAVAYK